MKISKWACLHTHAPLPQGHGITISRVPLRLQRVKYGRPGTSESYRMRRGLARSGGVAQRQRDRAQEGRHPVQERFDWTGARQMEENTILVLFDLRGDLEQCEENR
jgi:hypothetical protein